jgi:hypothetical protein
MLKYVQLLWSRGCIYYVHTFLNGWICLGAGRVGESGNVRGERSLGILLKNYYIQLLFYLVFVSNTCRTEELIYVDKI